MNKGFPPHRAPAYAASLALGGILAAREVKQGDKFSLAVSPLVCALLVEGRICRVEQINNRVTIVDQAEMVTARDNTQAVIELVYG